MADLTFERTSKTLSGFGKAWTATSGTSSIASLDAGLYLVPPNALMAGAANTSGVPANSLYASPSYRDGQGFGWFLWLGKGNLGIHPDGGPPGTLGCIGITSANTRDLFDELAKRNGLGISVEVR